MAYHSNGGYSGDERESRSGDDRPDSDLSDKPIYLLEHLATFTVNKETGIVYPADGMRRLLQLEKTTGIWSQKMQLCLDNQWVLIMDYETGNIIERFPASLIQEPTAFTSNDPMEMYNNILVFIVAGGSGSRSEMHIFQCQSISAVHLVEDLKQLRNGKVVTQHRETIPPPPMKTSSSSLRDQYGMREVTSGYHHETDSELGGLNDETSSTSSDKYERDVTVLNHCFDDIEKFIARLQHAAAASRELERRRRNRKSKKKDPGEGLLTLRTRPPHEKEFIDIFAKFKLSFNLLAKLKAHIHDPNAPELVHFLFTPLALIVEAASDTYYESHLPARVINPLLTREAVNLLINCVTSKETELWRSLGDAWTIPRDQWKGHIGSYHPVFFDGWSPDYPVVDELEHPTTPTNQKRRIETHHNFGGNSAAVGPAAGSGDYDFDGPSTPRESHKYIHHHHHHTAERSGSGGGGGGGGSITGVGGNNQGQSQVPTVGGPVGPAGFRDFSARSDISIDSIERNGGSSVGNNGTPGGGGLPGSGGSNIGQNVNNSAIQNLVGGIQNMGGIQSNNSSTAQDQHIETWLDELQARGAKIVQVTYPRTANNDKELTVIRGEYLEVLDDSRKWWKARNRRGQIAHVPHTIVTPFNYNEPSEGFNSSLYAQNYSKNVVSGNGRQNDSVSDSQGSGSGLPPQNSADWVRNKHIDQGKYHHHHQNSTKVQENLTSKSNKSNKSRSNNLQRSSSGAVPPPPPPPPPITLPPPAQIKTLPRNSNITNNSTIKSTSSSCSSGTIGPQNEMQEELKKVLTLFREKRPNWDKFKTPEIYIQQSSSPAEIEDWLRAKGFSENVVNKLRGLNGNELFALKKDTLEEYCGQEEGRRLDSQITIQRNVSGYKTARTSELQAILARARQKTEQPEQH